MPAKILGIRIDKMTTEEVLEKIKSFLLSDKSSHIDSEDKKDKKNSYPDKGGWGIGNTKNKSLSFRTAREKSIVSDVSKNLDFSPPDGRIKMTTPKQNYIITLNPEMVVEAQKDEYFKKIINKAGLVVADGAGILWALDFLSQNDRGQPKNAIANFISSLFKFLIFPNRRKNILKHRMHGIDLIYKICEQNFIKDKKIYLIGAGEGIAEKTKSELLRKYPYLNIVGAEEGISKKIFNFQFSIFPPMADPQKVDNKHSISFDNTEYNKLNNALIQKINNVSPDILFVAFGAPKQEKWIYENLKKIPSVKLAIGVGGSFDFISGKTKRAPLIVQKFGLEWLWRLVLEPWRMKRIYNATVKFGLLVLKAKLNNSK